MNQHPENGRGRPAGASDSRLPDGAKDPGAGRALSQRKPYSAPVLMEYGTIAKLTQGTRTRNNDGANTRKRKACL